MATLRAALRLGCAAPGALAAMVVLVLVGAAPSIGIAWFTKLLFDEVGRGRAASPSTATWYAVAIAGLAALAAIANRLSGYVTAVLQQAITIAADARLYRKLNSFLGLGPFEQPALRDRLALAQQAADQAPYAVVLFVVNVAQNVVTIGGFAAILASLWPPAGLLLLAVAGPEFLIQLRLSRRAARAVEDSAGLFRARLLFQTVLTDLRAAREVRLFQLGRFFHDRLTGAVRAAGRIELDAARHATLVQGGWALAGSAVTLVATVVAVGAAVRGRLSLGDLTLVLAAFGAAQGGLAGIAGQLGEVGAALRLFRHYVAVLDSPADLVDGTRTTPPLRTGIRFEDVWFRYDEGGPWVLRGLDLTIPAGQAVGLVGLNGAGKSTLVKLLCRFYDPDRGRITWDGVDLRELRVETVRRRMGAVFQDFMCYDLTAAENVGIGRLPHTSEQVEQAAARAEIHDRLRALPHGYATLLSRTFAGQDGEPGVALSGGQWQRVALARSLMRADADLLVLDEPSSGLDADAETRVHASLARLRQGRTGLLISHRLSTLRDARRIVVLDAGRVVESGTHDELMTADGEYARLFRLQADGYQLAAS
ncbi:ABC transporter ATP-binding protein [Micromonospora auratinigra]|uniref:ATP-binding cassette, subfamily B n=1 Tax=Micromonospora auratinigra TaxID=261654 RepID=A0A1A8ZHG7_9ACTN|nr:ABC transporter ATP-binding protein [Micromonospora auratinigra]SBT43474.1 ATP-binding cassette, subfamily B [Micromonospora auratinigra]